MKKLFIMLGAAAALFFSSPGAAVAAPSGCVDLQRRMSIECPQQSETEMWGIKEWSTYINERIRETVTDGERPDVCANGNCRNGSTRAAREKAPPRNRPAR